MCLLQKRACLHGGGGPQIGEVTCEGSPHLSCKRDQIKMRDNMGRRVTLPTWGPPPRLTKGPCHGCLVYANNTRPYSEWNLRNYS